jgi:hypothetical protein
MFLVKRLGNVPCVETFKEVSRIPVGQVPKRNLKAILQAIDGDSRQLARAP